MECSSGVFRVSTTCIAVWSAGCLVAEKLRFSPFLPLQDTALEGACGAAAELANTVQLEIGQTERSTVAVDQGYHSISHANREDGAFIRQVLVPAGDQIEMCRHLRQSAEKETAAFAQIEENGGLIERHAELFQPSAIQTRPGCQPPAGH